MEPLSDDEKNELFRRCRFLAENYCGFSSYRNNILMVDPTIWVIAHQTRRVDVRVYLNGSHELVARLYLDSDSKWYDLEARTALEAIRKFMVLDDLADV